MIAIADEPATTTETAPEKAPERPSRSRKGAGGPKTTEGKARSARNALKHGLRSKSLLPDDLAELAARRAEEFADELAPETPYQRWLVEQAALASARIDRCAEMALHDLRRRVERAELCWDDDRRAAAEQLARRLPAEPERVAPALKRSPQGVEWMIERWEALAASAARGRWDDDQQRLAYDLLGVPASLREFWPSLPDDAEAELQARLADTQIDELREYRDLALEHVDATERELARIGMPLHDDGPSRALKRAENACRRELRWALDELRRLRPDLAADLPRAPARRTAGQLALDAEVPEPDWATMDLPMGLDDLAPLVADGGAAHPDDAQDDAIPGPAERLDVHDPGASVGSSGDGSTPSERSARASASPRPAREGSPWPRGDGDHDSDGDDRGLDGSLPLNRRARRYLARLERQS